jgi:hypothetical protein
MKFILTLTALFFIQILFAQVITSSEKGASFMANSSAMFEENIGQIEGQDNQEVQFFYKANEASVFLLNTGMAYQFSKTHYPKGYKIPSKSNTSEEREMSALLEKDIRIETYRMDVVFQNANPAPRITAEGKSSDYTQFYNRNTLNVHKYKKITYHNVYPHIDWVVYSIKQKNVIACCHFHFLFYFYLKLKNIYYCYRYYYHFLLLLLLRK